MTGGAFSRSKGARGELEIVHMLRDNLGLTVNRNYKQTAQAQHGDIEQLVGGHLLEIKNCKGLEIPAWWRQVVRASEAHPDKPRPCLAYKIQGARDPFKWRFIVPMREAWGGGKWSGGLEYTQTLFQDGFFLLVREHS